MNEVTLNPNLAEKVAKHGILKHFSKGEAILRENAYIRSIPIVQSGSVKVMRTDPDGREILLYYITPGESCIMSFLGGMHHEQSKVKVVADSETDISMVPIEKVLSMLKEDTEWLTYLFKLYHLRFEELLEVVNAVSFKKMDERLMHLLEMKVEVGQSKELHVTHEELANELGTARVVISRLLKILEHEGVIALGRNKITLL